MTAPAVSVIIPSFDRYQMLERCVESVFASDPVPDGGIEVIVVTAAATSAQFGPIRYLGVHVVLLPSKALVSLSRNAGAAQARGRYVLFLDDDNVVAPDAIWRLWRAMEVTDKPALVGPAMYY